MLFFYRILTSLTARGKETLTLHSSIWHWFGGVVQGWVRRTPGLASMADGGLGEEEE